MSELNLVQKLLEIQKKLKAPKNQRNNFGKYNYRSCEDILEAVKPLNAAAGILLTISDDIELVDGRHYVKATCKVTDGKDEIIVTASAREADNKKGMDTAQVTGATSSYARKYALNGLYLIDDTKDVDTEEYEMQQNTSANKQQSSFKHNNFAMNRNEVVERLRKVAEIKGIPYEKGKQKVIERVNKDLNREDKDIVPANIARVIGYVKRMEQDLNKGR